MPTCGHQALTKRPRIDHKTYKMPQLACPLH